MMTRFKTIVVFYKELANALKDGKVSFEEGIGMLPELVAFLSTFKELDELRKEITTLQDRFNDTDPNQFKQFLIDNGISLESDLAWSISEAIFWTVHSLTLLKK